MWFVEKVVVNVRYLDEQANQRLRLTHTASTESAVIRVYWSWDWYIVCRADGQLTPTNGAFVLANTYIMTSRKCWYWFGIPDLTARHRIAENYEIPRVGCGSWEVQNNLTIWDVKKDCATTQTTVAGSWNRWMAYGRSTITKTI
jgi:hypothetical protein